MTTCYTHRLRPLAQRMANGVAETKGYNGTVLAPWRTGKRQVKSLYRVKGQLTWTDESNCSAKAKGYPAEVVVVDNNGEKGPTTRVKNDTHRPEALPRLESATPWQGQVKENTKVSLRRKARLLANQTGDTTLQWAGQMELTVVPQAKPMVGKGKYWYEVDRVEGFIHATTEERDEACLEQLRCFVSRHRKVVYDVATCIAKGKYEAKAKSLDNALRLAFDARPKTASDAALSIDARAIEDEESSWMPATGDLMAEMEEKAAKREWMDLLNKVLAGLTRKQREAVEMKAAGLTLDGAQRFNLMAARKKACVG